MAVGDITSLAGMNAGPKKEGVMGLTQALVDKGKAKMNQAITQLEDITITCKQLQAEARGFDDDGQLAAYMTLALTSAEDMKGTLKSIQGYAVSAEEEFMMATKKSMQDIERILGGMLKKGTKETKKEKDFFSDPLGWMGDRANDIGNGFVSFSKAASAYGQSWLRDPIGTLRSTGADIINAGIAFESGVASVGEDIVDFGAIILTGAATPFTAIYDYATGSNVTNDMWKGTMSFVAEDHVQSTIKSWYAEGGALSVLDKYAHDAFKSNGVGCQIANGVGYVAGTVALTAATAGIGGGVSAGAVGARTVGTAAGKAFIKTAPKVAFASGAGRGTEEYWAEQRASTPEGQEWRTTETLLKGLGYGTATGAWEAAQWYTGAKIATMPMSSVARVGIDSVFNAGDTPFRAAIDSAISGKSFEKAFNERGGWQAVGTSFAIGFIPSVGGEIALKSGYVDIASKNIAIKNIDKAKKGFSKFFTGQRQGVYFSEQELKEAYSKVIVFDSQEAANTAISHAFPGSDPLTTVAFNSNGITYLRPNNNAKTVAHEINHTLGHIKDIDRFRALNEAFTESIALKIMPKSRNDSGYKKNVKILNEIVNLLESKGYKDVDLQAYYLSDNSFENAVDSIAGKGFYEELGIQMNMAQGQATFSAAPAFSSSQILAAQKQLEQMVEYFRNCCN